MFARWKEDISESFESSDGFKVDGLNYSRIEANSRSFKRFLAIIPGDTEDALECDKTGDTEERETESWDKDGKYKDP